MNNPAGFFSCYLLYCAAPTGEDSVVHAVTGVMHEILMTGTTHGAFGAMVLFNDFNQFTGLSEIREGEQKYQLP